MRPLSSSALSAAPRVLLLLLCAQTVAANVRADNFHTRHLLHSEHDRYFETLAAAPQDEDGVWHYNDAAAPLVNRESIGKARQMEMADDGAADEVPILCAGLLLFCSVRFWPWGFLATRPSSWHSWI